MVYPISIEDLYRGTTGEQQKGFSVLTSVRYTVQFNDEAF
jgi:hypothetical protein